jgi:hypothetical protein
MKTLNHFQRFIAVLRQYMAEPFLTSKEPTYKVAFLMTQSGRATRHLVTLPPQLYTCPGKGAGKDFINQPCKEFSGITERKWNSERPLVFCLAMLQKKPGITQCKSASTTASRNGWQTSIKRLSKLQST